jgi:hypothetical protein
VQPEGLSQPAAVCRGWGILLAKEVRRPDGRPGDSDRIVLDVQKAVSR